MNEYPGRSSIKNQKLNTIKLLTAVAASFFLGACGQNPTSPDSNTRTDATDGAVKSTVVLGKVGVLSKTAAINLRTVKFTLSSSAGDTVLDSATVSGNGQVTFTKVFTLKPLRTWVISAKSYDLKDSIIHSGSSAPFVVNPADTANVSLSLDSRYTMYQAAFAALPDSISASGTGTGKDKLNLNHVVLKVDGAVKVDSTLASGYFSASQVVNLYFDYITPGAHSVTLEAYGVLHTFSGLLYTGSTSFNVAPGVDDTKSVTLGWVGPTTGNGKLNVVLGRVGKAVVNGTLPGTVIP
jgi:hypothetical protein